MDRRIYGIETEYGLACTRQGTRKLADEVARYMFRSVVARARSSNVFLANGSRLYLDVGNHPEYATAECDTLPDLLAQEQAGDRFILELADQARARLTLENIDAEIYVFKNNVDSAGNSYGCHENYLVDRDGDLFALTERLLPFLMSRQLICGAGRLVPAEPGSGDSPTYCLSQRADVMWEGASSATTRARPMINTRDEPHADAQRYRRLHVIVGDSNLLQASTLLKVGSTDLVLRVIEAGVPLPDLSLPSKPAAIRAMSRDLTGRALVRTQRGSTVSALDIQRTYHAAVAAYLQDRGPARPMDEEVFELWTRVLEAVETGRPDELATEIDWVAKLHLIDRYAQRHGLSLGHPRLAQLDLAYHDLQPGRGLASLLRRAGRARVVVGDQQVIQAMSTPPQTTRARMRGRFVAAASAHGRDYTVDWSHLRLNDEAARTVMCKDPFVADDPRVERLLQALGEPAKVTESLQSQPDPHPGAS
ncbi:MAG: Pup--protein ligase [Austwickia sp.]|nr:Pup--protein ligase [Austwickia sp.]